MKDYKIKIFSYFPNPRIWKTTITARLSDVNLSIKGTEPENIKNWLWDFNARELTETDKKEFKNKTSSVGTGFSTKLHKTEDFLRTQPFGTVPAAFSPDGEIGIFESNSIMRLAARLGKNKNNIYGENDYESSRIDSFLDASLIFARASQIYLLSISSDTLTESIKQNAKDAYITYMNGIESALNSNKNPYLVGEQLTLADICFFCEYALFSREQIKPTTQKEKEWNSILNTLNKDNFTKAVSHYNKLSQIPAFAEDSVEYLKKIDIAISN